MEVKITLDKKNVAGKLPLQKSYKTGRNQDDTETVSYTHLDVYKRQLYMLCALQNSTKPKLLKQKVWDAVQWDVVCTTSNCSHNSLNCRKELQ